MFSSRVPSRLDTNALSRALGAARTSARPIVDLTATNPTTAGFAYPPELPARLCPPAALVYEPAPLGLATARAAVAADYARRGRAVDPGRIVLTASSSEAYSLLFKLLCAPGGDAVLTPAPSYPLFEHLTRLDGVEPVPYALEYHGRWSVDGESVARAWTPRTRAVLAVSPNNPTGSLLSPAEEAALADACAARGAALIIDEVFADYPLHDRADEAGERGPTPALTFRLGGLSKSAGLPQVKLGWIAVEGPEAPVLDALARLEFICDAYLSVSTPVQHAAAGLFADGAVVRRQIQERVRANYRRLRELAGRHPAADVLHADAGWSAVVRVPARQSEEAIVLELLERDGVLVHPGFFFDFPEEAYLVVSLLVPPAAFAAGVARVLERTAGG